MEDYKVHHFCLTSCSALTEEVVVMFYFYRWKMLGRPPNSSFCLTRIPRTSTFLAAPTTSSSCLTTATSTWPPSHHQGTWAPSSLASTTGPSSWTCSGKLWSVACHLHQYEKVQTNACYFILTWTHSVHIFGEILRTLN